MQNYERPDEWGFPSGADAETHPIGAIFRLWGVGLNNDGVADISSSPREHREKQLLASTRVFEAEGFTDRQRELAIGTAALLGLMGRIQRSLPVFTLRTRFRTTGQAMYPVVASLAGKPGHLIPSKVSPPVQPLVTFEGHEIGQETQVNATSTLLWLTHRDHPDRAPILHQQMAVFLAEASDNS